MAGSWFDASVWFAVVAALVAVVSGILFLRTRDFFYDTLALAVTKAGVALLAAGIVAGAIADHSAAGLWWTWDARLTAALVGWLLYASYLMLRAAIEEPSQRAAAAAVVSIFAFFDAPLAVLAVRWWLAHHAAPGQSAALRAAPWWAILLVMLFGATLAWTRFRQERRRRAIDAERRTAQEL
jgi:heme exporter protein C